MRFTILTLVLLSGCASMKVDEPIALVTDEDWTSAERDLLSGAAHCWNLQFGTDIVLQEEATHRQVVEVFFHEHACTLSTGNYQPGLPGQIAVCPYRIEDKQKLFTVLLHELGHVLNIRAHARDSAAVMGISRQKWEELDDGEAPVFADEDRELFGEANPAFEPRPACTELRIEPRRLAYEGVPFCHCP